MTERKVWLSALAGILFLCSGPLRGAEISLEGGPMETGFNSGTFAYIHATVHGLAGQPKRYVVFAEIQYYGTTSNTSVEMDRLPETKSGVEEFQVGWPIPFQAPTGFYTLTLHVDDRIDHIPGITKKVRGFVVYKKSVRISRVSLDKALYSVGEPIRCGVALENLTDTPLKGLRVEFSNAIYPWISLSSQGGRENPDLAVTMLHDNVDIAPGTAVGVPMVTAATAAFLRGKNGDEMASSGAADPAKPLTSEVDDYSVTVWNADHTILYDMQFTPQVIIRTLSSDLPKAYNSGYAHPAIAQTDFAGYRDFYAPGQISPAITLDHSSTLFRAGDSVVRQFTVKNTGEEVWPGAHVVVKVTDGQGRERGGSTNLMPAQDYAPGQSRGASAVAWVVGAQEPPGLFSLKFSVVNSQGRVLANSSQEIAVNRLPSSLLVVCAHEGDEQAYAGLIRACLESKIPVEILILTGGDMTNCARYFAKPCGPHEALEFAEVRMEESAQALGHLGLPRDKLNILGLPEAGLGEIWSKHKESSNPYLSIFLACDHAPFGNVYKPNLAYARDAVIEAIRQVLTDFHPAMIALSHPDDGNVDHRAASWLTIEACHQLLKTKEIEPQTIVLANRSFGAGSSQSAPYQYEHFEVHLSGEAAALKQEMSWIYQTQDGNQAEADRKTMAELPREEQHLRIVDWQEHAGWNEGSRN
jgi:LmbE family N-acetylglucosaminyl deacetylase